ncbi:GNAT family N-acetyltransferase [Spartinivicinus poritis]|uniref:GNAT family N-acetyltransferase n=1 Tax=Spartinivicinus poritis TaxID=2994640 RepID=A0ABT5UD39_9GAMM|nr:GNAT family N-acetyltransferase [Spartinivicinus sp. A2-2]MDE1464286.1 GNAT family N-acetyltransferase [Spartinivicinus sp. A2-2]
MDIYKYTSSEFKNCIGLFISNADKFFDKSELEQYAEFLSGEALNGDYFIVKQNNLTVGAGGFVIHENAFWLDWGIVHRSKHRQGIGTKLLEYRLSKIYQENKSPTIRLCTSQHTVGFYKKYGFKVLSFTKNGYGVNLHKYMLEKRVDQIRAVT